MNFTAERSTLAEAVAKAQRAVASRTGALPVLSGLRLAVDDGRLELVGSDLELTIRVTMSVDGSGTEPVVLPARLLSDVVRELAGKTVKVDVDSDEAKLQSEKASITLRTLAAADFPRLVDVDGAGVKVEAQAFEDALRQVVRAASNDDARPILTGVLLTTSSGGLRLVATDSYRLAVRDLPGVSMLREGQKVLVAAKGLGEVQRLIEKGEVEVVLGEREVLFRVDETEVTTRLIEGDFPNYEQLIPSSYPNRLIVGREALADAVRRVRLVGQGRDNAPVRLAMSAAGLELSAIAQDVGEAHEDVEAKYEGGDVTVAFNSQFLLDGIEAISSEEVSIETIDPLKPAVMRGSGAPDYLYLLMPVRIS